MRFKPTLQPAENELKPNQLRIANGPNRGVIWSVAAGGDGYGNGEFEKSRMHAIARLVRTGDCFWDIGAHWGYVTAMASRLVGASGSVYAFEPSTSNRAFIELHANWNMLANVNIQPFALSDFDGTAMLGFENDIPLRSFCLRLGIGDELVTVRSVASLLEKEHLQPPTCIKIDAEFSELAILNGMGKHTFNPDLALIIGVHTPALYAQCYQLLRSRDMEVIVPQYVYTFDRRAWRDVEVVALGRNRVVSDADRVIYRSIEPI